jgi:hypothetical protein
MGWRSGLKGNAMVISFPFNYAFNHAITNEKRYMKRLDAEQKMQTLELPNPAIYIPK